jgi:hypothetical protein
MLWVRRTPVDAKVLFEINCWEKHDKSPSHYDACMSVAKKGFTVKSWDILNL